MHNIHTITADCPIDCLKTIISGKSFNSLARAYRAPFEPPVTVQEVLDLLAQDRLDDIWGLGPRRIGEIKVSLVFAGLLDILPNGHHGSAQSSAQHVRPPDSGK